MRIATSSQAREADRLAIEELGIDGRVLMENAGRGAAADLDARLGKPRCKVLILCGGGNNGGDGYVIARHLRIAGHFVKVFLLGSPDRLSKDCTYNRSIAARLSALDGAHAPCPAVWDADYQYIQTLDIKDGAALEGVRDLFVSADCIVDAMLGTGLKSDVTGLYADAIAMINERRAADEPNLSPHGGSDPAGSVAAGPFVAAADIPSGLDADTGNPRGIALKADLTYTFGIPKVGLYLHPGHEYAGEVVQVGIGMPNELIERAGAPAIELMDLPLARSILPSRTGNYHKGNAGHLLVIAGSHDKPGAALLACKAAMRTGVGLCTLASASEVLSGLAGSMQEVMCHPLETGRDGYRELSDDEFTAMLSGKDAVAIGPGIPQGPATLAFLLRLLKRFDGPVVIDADGLNTIAGHAVEVKESACRMVLTPHPGEISRLMDRGTKDVQSDRLKAAVDCSRLYHAVTVLKGAGTVISDCTGDRITVNPTGNPGMASGGMGDVLTGIIGAFCAGSIGVYDAARAGAFIHGLAADLVVENGSMASLIATDVINGLQASFAAVER